MVHLSECPWRVESPQIPWLLAVVSYQETNPGGKKPIIIHGNKSDSFFLQWLCPIAHSIEKIGLKGNQNKCGHVIFLWPVQSQMFSIWTCPVNSAHVPSDFVLAVAPLFQISAVKLQWVQYVFISSWKYGHRPGVQGTGKKKKLCFKRWLNRNQLIFINTSRQLGVPVDLVVFEVHQSSGESVSICVSKASAALKV